MSETGSIYITDSQLDGLSDAERTLIHQVTDFVRDYFQNPKFDSSHDFNHVMRVTRTALEILRQQNKLLADNGRPALNAKIVVLGALLHDVGDRKYATSSDIGLPLAQQKLTELGVAEADASIIQDLVDGVSYSSEIKSPERVQALVQRIPELAVVQDADRLDAIGAIGIGRCFTFGGARGARSLEDSLQHFQDKLLKLQSMMKTAAGQEMGVERTARISEFMHWWEVETSVNGHA